MVGEPTRKPLLVVSILVIVAATVMAFLGAGESGVTTDEPTQLSRTQSWIDHGWYLPARELEDTGLDAGSRYVYGPATSALGHATNVLAGNEAWESTSTSAVAWRARHLVTVLIGLLAAVAVGIAVRELTGSVVIALWSAAALLAVPLWLGMSFFNLKDVPVASGYTLVTSGLVLALARAREPGLATRASVGAMVGAGVYLSVGTRIAMWAPVAIAVAMYAIALLARRRTGNGGDPWLPLAVLAGLAGAGLVLVLLYPSAFGHPFTALRSSVAESTDYPWEGFTLTAGRLLDEYPPWWYLPVWTLATVPILLMVFAMIGGATRIAGALSDLRGSARLRALAREPNPGTALVLAQVLALPLASIITGANMYSGLRQHLYVLPGLAILGGLGASWVIGLSRRRGPARWPGLLTALVLSLALLVPFVEQVRLFPYNYAYVNPVASIGGVNGRWETDFWFASMREAMTKVPAGEVLHCGSLIPQGQAADSFTLFWKCDPALTAPFEDEQGTEAGASPGHTAWVVAARRAGNVPPSYCRTADEITRPMRGSEVVMAYVLRCDAERLARYTIDSSR